VGVLGSGEVVRVGIEGDGRTCVSDDPEEVGTLAPGAIIAEAAT
jgi:hypothetical protein